MFILFPTVHRKTNFLVNLYWDNKYSDSDSERGHKIVHTVDWKTNKPQNMSRNIYGLPSLFFF